MNDILIIDDEPGIRTTLSSILEDEKYRVRAAEDAIAGIAQLEDSRFSLIFLDVWLPRMGGLEALEKIRAKWPETEVVVISGHANIDMAVRAVKLGAFDFLEKPLSLDKVLTVTRNAMAMQRLRVENAGLKKALPEVELIGDSPSMVQVRRLIDQAAGSDARILVRGENGTGKELVARSIHQKSPRAAFPFVEVNCAAIPEQLIESELFGHERGAFTDAVANRKGRFELASGGTLFLDEIGDMSLSAQAKVLRVIQEQKIERVGGERTIDVDVRIVAATNKDLEQACKSGAFREDLFFRLNVIPIQLPSLRERTADIPVLFARFLAEFGAAALSVSDEAVAVLQAHPWPGNVRELRNLAERVAVMCDDSVLSASSVKDLLDRKEAPPAATSPCPEAGLLAELWGMEFNEARELFEKRYLEYKLSRNGYTISRTAQEIGMYPSNLHAKIKKHGIQVER